MDTIEIVFQKHLSPRGEWHVDGVRVAPEDIHDSAADHRRRAGRYFRPRQTAPHRICAATCRMTAASTSKWKAPGITASSAAGAGARRSIRRCATSSGRRTSAAPTAGAKPPLIAQRRQQGLKPPPRRAEAGNRPPARPASTPQSAPVSKTARPVAAPCGAGRAWMRCRKAARCGCSAPEPETRRHRLQRKAHHDVGGAEGLSREPGPRRQLAFQIAALGRQLRYVISRARPCRRHHAAPA